jgi:hypothetical protein
MLALDPYAVVVPYTTVLVAATFVVHWIVTEDDVKPVMAAFEIATVAAKVGDVPSNARQQAAMMTDCGNNWQDNRRKIVATLCLLRPLITGKLWLTPGDPERMPRNTARRSAVRVTADDAEITGPQIRCAWAPAVTLSRDTNAFVNVNLKLMGSAWKEIGPLSKSLPA